MQTTFLTHPQNFRHNQEAISYNELGYTTLSVAEPLEEALASARLLATQEA